MRTYIYRQTRTSCWSILRSVATFRSSILRLRGVCLSACHKLWFRRRKLLTQVSLVCGWLCGGASVRYRAELPRVESLKAKAKLFRGFQARWRNGRRVQCGHLSLIIVDCCNFKCNSLIVIGSVNTLAHTCLCIFGTRQR